MHMYMACLIYKGQVSSSIVTVGKQAQSDADEYVYLVMETSLSVTSYILSMKREKSQQMSEDMEERAEENGEHMRWLSKIMKE